MWRNMDMDRVIGGVLLMALHELDVVGRQRQLLRHSWPQLRAARSSAALAGWRRELRRQWRDARREDRGIRLELWQGLRQDLRQNLRGPARAPESRI